MMFVEFGKVCMAAAFFTAFWIGKPMIELAVSVRWKNPRCRPCGCDQFCFPQKRNHFWGKKIWLLRNKMRNFGRSKKVVSDNVSFQRHFFSGLLQAYRKRQYKNDARLISRKSRKPVVQDSSISFSEPPFSIALRILSVPQTTSNGFLPNSYS